MLNMVPSDKPISLAAALLEMAVPAMQSANYSKI